MLQFFRKNDPYRLIIIFILMVLIRVVQSYFIHAPSYYELKWLLLGEWLNQGFKMYSETFDYTGAFAVFVYKYLNFLFGRNVLSHYALSSIVIFIQAGVFNQLLLKNKAYGESSYLPAFLYMILMVSIPDFMILSPQLLSLTFILLALRNVLRRIDNQVTDELFLNSGIYIGIATMIHLPSIVFFLIFIIALVLFSTVAARRILLYLFGFLLVFSMCALYFYWTGNFWSFIDGYLIQSLGMNSSSPLTLQEGLYLSIFFIVILILSVFKTWGVARLTNFQQKIQQVMWLVFLGGLSTFFLSNENSLLELVFVMPLIAYLWTHYFLLIRRRFFKFIMPGGLIFGLLIFTTFSYKTLTKPLEATPVEVASEGTMILGGTLNYYQNISMNTPCFNVHMTRYAFEGLGYYGSAGRLYKFFQKVDPELIIDDIGVMTRLTQRFPEIEAAYRKKSHNVYEKLNSD